MSRAIHHLDLWVDDVERAEGEWGWLLAWCGWQREAGMVSWVHDDGTYLFMEHSPDQHGAHDRLLPGINHLASDARRGGRAQRSAGLGCRVAQLNPAPTLGRYACRPTP